MKSQRWHFSSRALRGDRRATRRVARPVALGWIRKRRSVASIPSNPDSFYRELTTRNRHFVDAETQKRIRDLKILVAGCGSGGGACIEPLARLGVTHFKIADVGEYELANLNRQHAFIDAIGINKATFHANELHRINPFVSVDAYTSGITENNLEELVGWADLIFDCVDVTTHEAIMLKLLMHERSKALKKPVFSMLDLGFCQWGESYDYRKDHVCSVPPNRRQFS